MRDIGPLKKGREPPSILLTSYSFRRRFIQETVAFATNEEGWTNWVHAARLTGHVEVACIEKRSPLNLCFSNVKTSEPHLSQTRSSISISIYNRSRTLFRTGLVPKDRVGPLEITTSFFHFVSCCKAGLALCLSLNPLKIDYPHTHTHTHAARFVLPMVACHAGARDALESV